MVLEIGIEDDSEKAQKPVQVKKVPTPVVDNSDSDFLYNSKKLLQIKEQMYSQKKPTFQNQMIQRVAPRKHVHFQQIPEHQERFENVQNYR